MPIKVKSLHEISVDNLPAVGLQATLDTLVKSRVGELVAALEAWAAELEKAYTENTDLIRKTLIQAQNEAVVKERQAAFQQADQAQQQITEKSDEAAKLALELSHAKAESKALRDSLVAALQDPAKAEQTRKDLRRFELEGTILAAQRELQTL